MKNIKLLTAILFTTVIFSHSPASANDELQLCGVVNDINTLEQIVLVDVSSENCTGLRKFKIPSDIVIKPDEVGQSICFYIDSARCNDGYIYTITDIERRLMP